MLTVRSSFRFFSLFGLILAMLASLGPVPSYNVALFIFAQITSQFSSHFFVTLFFCVLGLSIALDILWIIIYSLNAWGILIYSIIMTSCLFLLKLPLIFITSRLYSELQCSVNSLVIVDNTEENNQAKQSTIPYQAPLDPLREPIRESSTYDRDSAHRYEV
jgi:hypothetical protein